MASFRKVFLLLAALVTVAGLVSAQPATCTAYTSNVPIIRSEGIAEEVGQVVIECKGGTSFVRGRTLNTINVQIFLNTNVTSRRTVSNSATPLEALLLIDDPTISEVTSSRICPAGTICAGTAVGGGVFKDPTVPNAYVYQGSWVANNSVVWSGVPFDAPGTTPLRTLRIVNVRAAANVLGVATGTLLPSQVSMFISISGTGAPNLTNSQLVVAYIQRGLLFRAGAGDNSGSNNDNGRTYLQCEPSDGSFGAASIRRFRLRFTERFNNAFKSNDIITGNQADLTVVYNTESMYYHPTVASTLGGNVGRATQPTRLMAVFSNLPAGVNLRVPTSVSHNGLTFFYINCLDSAGSACTFFGISGSSATPTITGGQAIVVYEAYYTDSVNSPVVAPNTISDIVIPVELRWGPSSNFSNPPGTGTVTVAGSYAPLSTNFTARTGEQPRFVPDPADTVSFTIAPCRTNLLFPYVTNQGGFDTGIAIANTSADKFGTVPQSGTCSIEYYGKTGASGAAPGAVTTESIPAGAVATASLQAGGGYGIPAAKDFEGYIIARCNFQYAHGYAAIYSLSTGGGIQAIGNYIALVLDAGKDDSYSGTVDFSTGAVSLTKGLTRTGSRSEVLGQ